MYLHVAVVSHISCGSLPLSTGISLAAGIQHFNLANFPEWGHEMHDCSALGASQSLSKLTVAPRPFHTPPLAIYIFQMTCPGRRVPPPCPHPCLHSERGRAQRQLLLVWPSHAIWSSDAFSGEFPGQACCRHPFLIPTKDGGPFWVVRYLCQELQGLATAVLGDTETCALQQAM